MIVDDENTRVAAMLAALVGAAAAPLRIGSPLVRRSSRPLQGCDQYRVSFIEKSRAVAECVSAPTLM